MTFNEFTVLIQKDLVSELNKDFNNICSEITTLDKLQGQTYTGLSLRRGGSHAGAVYNLSDAFRRYQENEPYGNLLRDAVKQMQLALNDLPAIPFDILSDYEAMKKHLTVQLVSVSQNEPVLDGVAFTEVADDLAMVYRIVLPAPDNCEKTILLKKGFIDSLGIPVDKLHQDALQNAALMHPFNIMSLPGYMASHCGLPEDPLPSEDILWIVTNNDMRLGASVLFYPGVPQRISEQLGGDYYIIPSSIHECLVCSSRINQSWEILEHMLNEVNSTVVDSEDILSDKLYYYDSASGVIETAMKHMAPVF